MTTEEVKNLILKNIPDAQIEVIDTTGTGDHFSAKITSPSFAGKTLMQQHKMVMSSVKEAMKGENAPLHALDIKTFV